MRGGSPRRVASNCFSWRSLLKAINPIRPGQYFVRRAVVHLQSDHFGLGPIAFESQNVPHLGAAPAVYGLVVIADDAQIAMLLGQRLDDSILAAVCVLIFVHEQVVEPLSLGSPRGGMPQKKFLGAEQEIVEIERPGAFQRLSDIDDRRPRPSAPCRFAPRRLPALAGRTTTSTG